MSLREAKRRSNPINNENNNGIGATHVALCDNISFYFINWCRVFRYTPLAMTCVCKKVLSLGGELERGYNDVDNTILEPLTRISNAYIHSQRTAPSPRCGEGKDGYVKDINQTTFLIRSIHHSLIHNDTNFSPITTFETIYSS